MIGNELCEEFGWFLIEMEWNYASPNSVTIVLKTTIYFSDWMIWMVVKWCLYFKDEVLHLTHECGSIKQVKLKN